MATISFEPYDPLWNGIPIYMREGLDRYITSGVPVGDFLSALLCNDLMRCLGHADDTNRHRLFEYGLFLHNVAPHDCFGSPDIYKAWIAQGGLRRIKPKQTEEDLI